MVKAAVIADVAVAFVVRGLGATALFIMNLVIARSLPQDQAGYFFLAFALLSIVAPISLVGLHTANLRFVGAAAAENDWGVVAGIARKSWLYCICVGGGISVFLYALSPFLSEYVFSKPEMEPVLKGAVYAILPLSLSILLAHQLQALRKVAQSIVILSIVMPMLVCILVLFLGLDYAYQISYVLIPCAFLGMALGFFWWFRALPELVTPCFDDIKDLVGACMPLWVVNIMSLAIMWSGQFIAGVFVSPEEFAQLAVAQRTANLVSFILIAVNLVMAPRYAALYKKGDIEQLRLLALMCVRLMLAISFPVAIVILMFSEHIMMVFGSGFSDASLLLVILSFGQLVNVASGSVGYLLSMSGHEKDLRNVVLVAGFFSVLVSVVATGFYGVVGAAFSTAVAVAIQNLLCVYFVKKRLGFNTLAIWVK